MGTVLFLLALALGNMMGGNTILMITIVGLIIIVVNLLGGIEAVIWLDVFQGFMLFASGIICLSVLLFSADGGPAAVWSIAKANGRMGFGPYDFDLTRLTFVVMAINGMFYAIQKYGTDQTVVQRYLTAKTDKAAIRASLLGILLTVPVWMLFMFIGTALFSYYKQHSLPAGFRPEQVFPYFIMTKLPVGVTGLILSAMISAAICSLSADLNSLAAVGVEDYYKKMRPNKSDAVNLKTGKWMVVISGLITIAIGTLYIKAGNEGVLGIIQTDAARRKGEEPDAQAIEQMKFMVRYKFEEESDPYYATARLWDDGLIDPRDTRTLLGYLLDICHEAQVRPLQANSFGVARL